MDNGTSSNSGTKNFLVKQNFEIDVLKHSHSQSHKIKIINFFHLTTPSKHRTTQKYPSFIIQN